MSRLVLVCMCQGASLVNTIWLDHGVFAAARQLVAGCRVAPRRAARAAAREATASGAWTVQAVGRREHRVVAPSSPSRRGRREMRCNATSTAAAGPLRARSRSTTERAARPCPGRERGFDRDDAPLQVHWNIDVARTRRSRSLTLH